MSDLKTSNENNERWLQKEREKSQKLYLQLSNVIQILDEYSKNFCILTKEKLEKERAELNNHSQTTYSHWKSPAQLQEEGYQEACDKVEQALKKITNECEVLSKTDTESFFHELAVFLFPEHFVSIMPIPAEYENYTMLRNEIYKRIDIIKEYNSNVEYFKLGLNDFKFRPYIYTTLAEAYKNRIIADYCTENFKQNEIFAPVSRITAELQTMYLETLALKLSWGNNSAREKKVASIRDLRHQTKSQLETANYARYQLEYLLGLYPQLQDVLDVEYKDLGIAKVEMPTEDEHDATRDWLSHEEYYSLSESERNQLALDRYISSRKKSKWQIGRDYELYVGYLCEKSWCHVEYTGSTLKFEDLGRDLIATLGDQIYIIQCKYWSQDKLIREKHIMQLYGTLGLV